MQYDKARSAAAEALADDAILDLHDFVTRSAGTRLRIVRRTVAALTPGEIWAHLANTPHWLDDFSDLVADTFERDEVLRLMAYGTLGHVFRHGVQSLAENVIRRVLTEGLEAAA